MTELKLIKLCRLGVAVHTFNPSAQEAEAVAEAEAEASQGVQSEPGF